MWGGMLGGGDGRGPGLAVDVDFGFSSGHCGGPDLRGDGVVGRACVYAVDGDRMVEYNRMVGYINNRVGR